MLARCSVEPRRAVVLLEVGDRCFLVGVGDGPMSLLAEIDPLTVRGQVSCPAGAASLSRFGELLERIRTKAKL